MSRRQTVCTSEQKFQRRIEVVRVAIKLGPQQALIKFGIPIRTIGSWVARFNEEGPEGLMDKSRAPRRVANKKDQNGALAEALKKLHKEEPGLNRMQIFAKLLTEPSQDLVTLSWLNRATRRLGLAQRRRKKENPHKTRYEIGRPGALQIDTKYVDKEGEKGQYLYQFTAIDETTRIRFLGGSLTKGAQAASKFLRSAVVYFRTLGIEVYRAQTDHGTEFTHPHNEATLEAYLKGDLDEPLFTKTCNELGIQHRKIRPRTPELNGKVERSHRIDNERFYSRFSFASDHALDHALKTVWMPEYNERRPHGSLGGMTPMDFLAKRLAEMEKENAQVTELPLAA